MASGAYSEAAWASGNNHTPTNIGINTQATARPNNQHTFLRNNHINHRIQTKTTTPMATEVIAGAGKLPFLFQLMEH